MTPKHYSSFKEIDTALKILALQRDIEKEHIFINFRKVTHMMYPKNIALKIGNYFQQKLMKLLFSGFR